MSKQNRYGLPHLCSTFHADCPFCTEDQAAAQAAAVADSMTAPKPGFLSAANQELVRDDGRFVVTRIKGTNITITRRKP